MSGFLSVSQCWVASSSFLSNVPLTLLVDPANLSCFSSLFPPFDSVDSSGEISPRMIFLPDRLPFSSRNVRSRFYCFPPPAAVLYEYLETRTFPGWISPFSRLQQKAQHNGWLICLLFSHMRPAGTCKVPPPPFSETAPPSFRDPLPWQAFLFSRV